MCERGAAVFRFGDGGPEKHQLSARVPVSRRVGPTGVCVCVCVCVCLIMSVKSL